MHEDAGKPVPESAVADLSALTAAYHTLTPSRALHPVVFGTSGHRGCSLHGTFNEDHVLAICQAICDLRGEWGGAGPLFIGRDTHALSEPAFETAVEVFAANGVQIRIQTGPGLARFTPTPVISHAILTYNRGRTSGLADGVVITPSHNPPEDGGFKYNPPTGGPADVGTTQGIARRANELLRSGLSDVRRVSYEQGLRAASTQEYDYVASYVRDLQNAIDLRAIADSGLRIGVDPMGGASVAYWQEIARQYGLNLTVVNDRVDPTFRFMTRDYDGKIRMDCSSPWAMKPLLALRDRYGVAFGNDPDADRHGIVTRSGGLMDPNHFLAVAVDYLSAFRPKWGADLKVGKTVVSSRIIDCAARKAGRTIFEVPVGFKWFVDGLLGLKNDCRLAFGGEESAGASFLRPDGQVWTTDKDGILLDLLAAEITARTGKDPAQYHRDLESAIGVRFHYRREDVPAGSAEKEILRNARPDHVSLRRLAGDEVKAVLDKAPGNAAAIGGLKVVTEYGWFAARPSGTEDACKIYAESQRSEEHLGQIQSEARAAIRALSGAGRAVAR